MPTSVRSNEYRVTSNACLSDVNRYPLIVNRKARRAVGEVSSLKATEQEARDSLVLKNQFLARKIASNVWKANPHLPFEDLVSAGIIGLIKAIDRYNSSKAQLSTFAYPYIYGEIQREIRDKWQPLKIQRKHYELKNKLRKLDELGLDETAIANSLKITPDHLRETREALAALGVGEFGIEREGCWGSPSLPNRVVENSEFGVHTLGLASPRVSNLEIPNSSWRIPNFNSPRMKEIFELICCWGRTTTLAIAHHLNITQGRARDYTGRLRKAGLIIKDGFFYQPNFEQVVVEGIKKQVQQKIEIVNYLAKLQEVIEIRAKLKKLEEELVKVGGERAEWLLKVASNAALK